MKISLSNLGKIMELKKVEIEDIILRDKMS